MSEHMIKTSEFLKTNSSDIDIEALIAETEAGPMLHAPAYLKDEILEKSQSISIQVPMKLQKQKKEISKQMQFLYYSLKISAAVIICLFQLVLIGKIPSGISFSWNEAVSDYRYTQMEQEIQKETSEKETQSIQTILNNIINGGHLND